MTDVATIYRALDRMREQKQPEPTLDERIAGALQALLPAIAQVVSDQLSGVEYPLPADRTDEVLRALEARSEQTPPLDLSPLLEAIDSLRQPDQPQGYTMEVVDFDYRNQPVVRIVPDVE